MSDDPFAPLGLTASATAEEVRDARRRLARDHHPDRGGDVERMRRINEAADAALARLAVPESETAPPPDQAAAPRERQSEPVGGRIQRDTPSFVVEALPVVTFDGLLVVASWLGEVVDEDPPYRLDTLLREPVGCWCRLDVVPDAGSSTVSLAVASVDGRPLPDVEVIRDIWVDQLNRVDWPVGP